MEKSEQGLVIVYSGPGKGKTTAALGLALRMAGHGRRVLVVQFLKGQETGEVRAAKLLPGVRVVQAGRPAFVDLAKPSRVDREMAAAGLREAEKALREASCDLLVLDEANVAVAHGLLAAEEVLKLVAGRGKTHVVLTGRDASAELVEAADLVTVMQEVKHPYRSGLGARAGIEY